MMNDKDIIKDLKCAAEWFTKHGRNTNTAIIDVCKRAVDIIKRHRADRERLIRLNNFQKDEIYNLKLDNKKARAEAIKEFEERWHNALKETRNRGFLKEPTIVSKTFEIASNITNIVVKEMLGKEDEEK
jgi:hypothetical protein